MSDTAVWSTESSEFLSVRDISGDGELDLPEWREGDLDVEERWSELLLRLEDAYNDLSLGVVADEVRWTT